MNYEVQQQLTFLYHLLADGEDSLPDSKLVPAENGRGKKTFFKFDPNAALRRGPVLEPSLTADLSEYFYQTHGGRYVQLSYCLPYHQSISSIVVFFDNGGQYRQPSSLQIKTRLKSLSRL
ncbi:hypothetical protein TNCV_3517431 [Trichonephila clavipes]|nr:hypothetical protein TNCV_3517431 [Trichonephila clavipes]